MNYKARHWMINRRKEFKLSQRDLALKCGVSQQCIGAIETGARNPKISNAKTLAKVLEVNWELFYPDFDEDSA